MGRGLSPCPLFVAWITVNPDFSESIRIVSVIHGLFGQPPGLFAKPLGRLEKLPVLLAIDAGAEVPKSVAVTPCEGYNAWPMVQSVGGKLV